MITVPWADMDSYSASKPEFAKQEELRIMGVTAKGFMPDEQLPPTVAEVVQSLYSAMAEHFGEGNLTGVQSPQQPDPEATYYRHVAFIHAEHEGKRIADLTFTTVQRERHAGGKVELTKGISDISLVLPLGDYTEASKQIIIAAWPHFIHLYCGEGSADDLYIFRKDGDKTVSSGHDAVLKKELGLDLPKKTIFLLESL